MLTNSKVKEIKNLETKSKARREAGLFVIEGIRMFLEAPSEWIEETYVTKDVLGREDCKEKLDSLDYEVIDEERMKKISDTMTPQGVLCIVRMPVYNADDIIKTAEDGSLFMILEDIQDPGNLGTIIRTGEAAGVKGVIMTKGTVDISNPKVIRSTMGSVYRVPFAYADDIGKVIKALKDNKVEVYAAHLKGRKLYDEVTYGRTAFLIGNEGNGLKDETAEMADTYVRIPMSGEVESLNAAIASSILMFEHFRQTR